MNNPAPHTKSIHHLPGSSLLWPRISDNFVNGWNVIWISQNSLLTHYRCWHSRPQESFFCISSCLIGTLFICAALFTACSKEGPYVFRDEVMHRLLRKPRTLSNLSLLLELTSIIRGRCLCLFVLSLWHVVCVKVDPACLSLFHLFSWCRTGTMALVSQLWWNQICSWENGAKYRNAVRKQIANMLGKKKVMAPLWMLAVVTQ